MSDEANVQVHCPIGGEPCQSMCDVPCGAQAKPHDPNHPYLRRLAAAHLAAEEGADLSLLPVVVAPKTAMTASGEQQ